MYGLSGDGVLVLNHDGLGSPCKQDGYSAGQDGKCLQQAVETHDRTVSRWAEVRIQILGESVKY